MAVQLYGALTSATSTLQEVNTRQAKQLLLIGNNLQLCALTTQH